MALARERPGLLRSLTAVGVLGTLTSTAACLCLCHDRLHWIPQPRVSTDETSLALEDAGTLALDNQVAALRRKVVDIRVAAPRTLGDGQAVGGSLSGHSLQEVVDSPMEEGRIPQAGRLGLRRLVDRLRKLAAGLAPMGLEVERMPRAVP